MADSNISDSPGSRKMGPAEKCNNFMRQFRDAESRELKKLTANQFMEVWSHYDEDGKVTSSSRRRRCLLSKSGVNVCGRGQALIFVIRVKYQ